MKGIPSWALDIEGKLSNIQEQINQLKGKGDEIVFEALETILIDINLEKNRIINYCTQIDLIPDDLECMAYLYYNLNKSYDGIINDLAAKQGHSIDRIQASLKESEVFYRLFDKQAFKYGDLLTNHVKIAKYITSYNITPKECPDHFKSWDAYQLFLTYFDEYIADEAKEGQYKEHSFLFNKLKSLDLIDNWSAKKWVEWLKDKDFLTPEAYNYCHNDKQPMVMAANGKYNNKDQIKRFDKILENHNLD